MTARDVALAKVAEKKQKEQKAREVEASNARYFKAQGEKFNKTLSKIVNSFKEDFIITHIKGEYSWRFKLRKPLSEYWPRKESQEFLVKLSVHHGEMRYWDEGPVESYSDWAVTVTVKGKQDFYCGAESGALETEFGTYMAKWY